MTDIHIIIKKEDCSCGDCEWVDITELDYRDYATDYNATVEKLTIRRTKIAHFDSVETVFKNEQWLGRPANSSPDTPLQLVEINRLAERKQDINFDACVDKLVDEYEAVVILDHYMTEHPTPKHAIKFSYPIDIITLKISAESFIQLMNDYAPIEIDYDLRDDKRVYSVML